MAGCSYTPRSQAMLTLGLLSTGEVAQVPCTGMSMGDAFPGGKHQFPRENELHLSPR